MFFYIIMITLMIYLIKTMLAKSKVNIAVNTVITDDYYDIPSQYILNTNMMFGFQIQAKSNPSSIANELFFQIMQHNLVYDPVKDTKILVENVMEYTK